MLPSSLIFSGHEKTGWGRYSAGIKECHVPLALMGPCQSAAVEDLALRENSGKFIALGLGNSLQITVAKK